MSRRRKTTGWHEDFRVRLRFEGRARTSFPGLRARRVGKGLDAEINYTVTLPVPEYESRTVKVRVADLLRPVLIGVTCDGSTISKHRYEQERLCIWDPDDEPDAKWVPEDGLFDLLLYTQLHLFREAHYRRTGEWLGPEAPHGPDREKDAA
jgi:hypothetical protein